MEMLCLPEVIELDAGGITYSPSTLLSASGLNRSAFSLPFPFKLPSLVLNLCLVDAPLLVCGLGGSEAVRVRDMNSLSRLVRLGFTTFSPSVVGGIGCLSCDVEKRLTLANGDSVLELMSDS